MVRQYLIRVDGVVGLDLHGQVAPINHADVVVVLATVAQGELGLGCGTTWTYIRWAHVVCVGTEAHTRHTPIDTVASSTSPNSAAPPSVHVCWVQVETRVLAGSKITRKIPALLFGKIPIAPSTQGTRVVYRSQPKRITISFSSIIAGKSNPLSVVVIRTERGKQWIVRGTRVGKT